MRVWCIYQCSSILDSDACVYDAHIYDPRSLILIHACMMHISLTFYPWPWCMYVWCIHLLSLILTHVCTMHACMMHLPMFLDPWLWCMCVWCIYLWSLIVIHACIYVPWSLIHACMMHEWFMHLWCGTFRWRTNGRTNKAILGVGYQLWYDVTG